MHLLYVSKICLLTLLKISYGIGIHLLGLLAVMALITYLKEDKCYFTKKVDKLRRTIYGYSTITKQ